MELLSLEFNCCLTPSINDKNRKQKAIGHLKCIYYYDAISSVKYHIRNSSSNNSN